MRGRLTTIIKGELPETEHDVDLDPYVKPGVRVCYTIPERGGWMYSAGDVEKVNRKSVNVKLDKKHGVPARVDKALIYEVVIFQ